MSQTPLADVLAPHHAAAPGAVALVSRGGETEVVCTGFFDLEQTAPMQRDTIFRIASMTKPITAAAVMILVDEGRLQLDDPIDAWLPELAGVPVLRTPSSELDDVLPAERPVSVRDLLESTAGWGFAEEFETPAMSALFGIQLGPLPAKVPPVDDWLATLSGIPLLDQPGRRWLYNTCSDLQGILVSRVSGQTFPDFLAERVFGPLRMPDTAFAVPPAKLNRLPTFYGQSESAHLEAMDRPAGEFSAMPAFPSGAGGLTSTVDDWHRFARMLLGAGTLDGATVLTPESVTAMTTDHLTPAQRESSRLFIEGQGWGYGGSVDSVALEPWNVPGRYGWVGGSGTAGHIIPSRDVATILFTQVAMSDPTYPAIMREFWTTVSNEGLPPETTVG